MSFDEEKRSPRTISSSWARCKDHPSKLFANPCVLNDNELVLSPFGKNEYLRKYDIENNKWKPFIPYPTELNIKFHTISVDTKNSRIFLYDGVNKLYVEFDLNKQLVTKCKKKKNSIVGNGKFTSSLILDNEFMVIGGSEKSRLLIFDSMKGKFNEYEMVQPTPCGHGTVLLEDSAQIIVFGGNDNVHLKKYLDTIYICDIKPEVSWKKLLKHKMPHKMWQFGCLLTKCKNFVIIFGGKAKNVNNDKNSLSAEIWILHLKTWKWTRSHLKTPKKAKFFAVLTPNEYVHLFEFESGFGHWKIHTSIIINTSSNDFKAHNENNTSLSQQVILLTDKVNSLEHENKEFKESQKEYKKKLKSLKADNKQLNHENDELRKQIKQLQNTQNGSGGFGNNNNIQTALVKAKNDYNELNAKYEQLQKSVNNKSNKFNGSGSNGNYNNNNYESWNYNDIISWINSLNNGRFSKYKNNLKKHLRNRNITGQNLVYLTMDDLQDFGVTDYSDIMSLLEQIKSLKNQQQTKKKSDNKNPFLSNDNDDFGNDNDDFFNNNTGANDTANQNVFDTFFN